MISPYVGIHAGYFVLLTVSNILHTRSFMVGSSRLHNGFSVV